MLIISYSLSNQLKTALARIDTLRKKILLTPVSLQTELLLRNQALHAHLSGWASLANQAITAQQLAEVLSLSFPKSPTVVVNKVIAFKQALNLIWEEWLANPKRVSFQDLASLAKTLSVSHINEQEVTTMLNYLQTGDVNPVIQAATAHLYFYPNRLCYLVALLFLCKYGYDINRFLSLEDYWAKHKEDYLQTLQNASKSANITLWLEYYCSTMIEQLEKVVETTTHPQAVPPRAEISLHKLNPRQKQIFANMSAPETTMTNRLVQSQFNISQITASRDLAFLASLGLVFPHGKGRSVYYTRI